MISTTEEEDLLVEWAELPEEVAKEESVVELLELSLPSTDPLADFPLADLEDATDCSSSAFPLSTDEGVEGDLAVCFRTG